MAQKILVSGASGHLGRLVLDALMARGVDAGDIIATTRDPSRLASYAARGVDVRAADFNDADLTRKAFAGADRMVLISTDALDDKGTRQRQQLAAIDAARAAGVVPKPLVPPSGVARSRKTVRVASSMLRTRAISPAAPESSRRSSRTSTQSPAEKRRTWSRPIRVTRNWLLVPLVAIVSTGETTEAFSRDHLNRAVPVAPATWTWTR